MVEHIHDECGVVGVYLPGSDTASRAYYGMVSLQHRGQESCGISLSNGDVIKSHKGMGLVQEVFHKDNLSQLTGHIAIGHVRYSTAGESSIENAQPFVGSSSMGSVAVAHNGQLVNYRALREMLQDNGATFSCTSDTEVILKLIARYYRGEGRISLAMQKVMQEIQGSYALCIMTKDALIGARDPCAIRPLVLGSFGGGHSRGDGLSACMGYALASESCALDAMGAAIVRDIMPGEVVVIDEDGLHSYPMASSYQAGARQASSHQTASCPPPALDSYRLQGYSAPWLSPRPAHCIFEYVYFARPDSIVDGISVQEARINMGKALAREESVLQDVLRRGETASETVVVGVPDSGLGAAEGYALQSGVHYGMGVIKNKYIGRSFIAPTQTEREEAVLVKLNAVRSVVRSKRVIVIDDSIVRGTTSYRLVSLLRRAGAKEVHFRVSSPEVMFPCHFGIDTPSRDELVSTRMNNAQLCHEIGADSLSFLSLRGMLDALASSMLQPSTATSGAIDEDNQTGNTHGKSAQDVSAPNGSAQDKRECFCEGCFTGKYPVPVVEG